MGRVMETTINSQDQGGLVFGLWYRFMPFAETAGRPDMGAITGLWVGTGNGNVDRNIAVVFVLDGGYTTLCVADDRLIRLTAC
jgi:hypothetical protein